MSLAFPGSALKKSWLFSESSSSFFVRQSTCVIWQSLLTGQSGSSLLFQFQFSNFTVLTIYLFPCRVFFVSPGLHIIGLARFQLCHSLGSSTCVLIFCGLLRKLLAGGVSDLIALCAADFALRDFQFCLGSLLQCFDRSLSGLYLLPLGIQRVVTAGNGFHPFPIFAVLVPAFKRIAFPCRLFQRHGPAVIRCRI